MQKVLTERPPSSIDVLSDVLSRMHLSGSVLFRAEFREPWSVMTPASCDLALLLPLRSERIIPFHVVSGGGCWLELAGADPVWLAAGDVVLLPHGHPHGLRGRDMAGTVPVGQLLPKPPWHDIPRVDHGGDGRATQIICGFVQCDELLLHPIVRHLPQLLHVSPDTTPTDRWLASTISRTAAEASDPTPGSRSMLPRLTELMFVEILRKYMHGLSVDEVGWFAAYNDGVTGLALKALHAAPLQAWTLNSLAREVGVSRTLLTGRFKHLLGQPPMQYLTHWRLQLAAQQLKANELPMKLIVERTGYESEAGFSRAFKRHFGLPPGDWRRRQLQSS